MKSKSVVKHRFFKGQHAQRGAGDYTRYVEYREGRDLEKSGREFFTGDREHIRGSEVRELWREQTGRGPVMHELILSPGLNCVEGQEYTRELMEKLERTKGQELQWYAVEHKNTEHHHIHVLIAGKDREGRPIKIDKGDHKHLREWGDRYIEREHQLDRYLDRELDRLVTSQEYTRDRGDALFNSLFGKDHEKERSKPAEQERGKEKDKEQERGEVVTPREWTRADIDYSRIDDEDKIRLKDGSLISKYDSSEHLQSVDERLKAGPYKNWLEQEDYSKMWSWIGTKEKAGESFYGTPPLKDEREQDTDRPKDEKYKEWDKERTIAELPDKEKIYRENEAFTKFSSLDELKQLEKGLEKHEIERISKQEYAQLKQWIAEKEKHGESYHEDKERDKHDKNERRKQRDRERREEKKIEKERLREAGRQFSDLERNFKQNFQERSSGIIHRGMGRQQRIHEFRGRLTDHHYIYQVGQDRQRLQQAMERDPGNREQYQKELDWLNDAARETMKDFERLDLDNLFGEKERGQEDRSDKKDSKERGEDKDRGEEKDRTDTPHRTDTTDRTETEVHRPEEEATTTNEESTTQTSDRQEKEEREPEREERDRDRDDEGRGR